MGDPVTQGAFFERMQQSDDKALEHHRRVRESIEKLREDMMKRMDDHAADDLIVANRVLVIETERSVEKTHAVKHGAWAGIFAGGAISGLWKLLEHFSK